MMDKKLSFTFKWIRFPLTLLIILIHCASPTEIGNWICDFTDIFLKRTLAQIAVPTFFLISGFLFFNQLQRWDTGVYIDKIKRRIFTLLVPYLLWNLFPITLGLLSIAASSIIHGGNPLPMWSSLIKNTNWLHTLWGTPPDGLDPSFLISGYPADIPMWYVRDLMIMVLFSPLIYYLIRSFKGYFVVLYAIVCLLFCLFKFEYFVYYIIGGYFAITGSSIVPSSRNAKYALYATTTVLLVICIMSYYFQSISICQRQLFILLRIFAPLSILCCAYDINDKYVAGLPPVTYQCSFFVFAFHDFYMLKFAKIILDMMLPWEYVPVVIVKFLLKPVVTYLLCMLVYICLKKICPRLLRLYAGNRIVA